MSSTVERRGGGVLLYVREELSPVEFCPSTEYPEQVWCRLGMSMGNDCCLGFVTAMHHRFFVMI